MTLDERVEAFTKKVIDLGGTIYTKRMLEKFIETWTEPDRARKPKMRFEKEKTWETGRRLARWAANNYDRFPCFLTESEKTIAEKRRSFADQLKPFLGIYTRTMLNEFYRYYGMPENKANPEYLRWEKMEYWDLSTQLTAWADREAKRRSREL